MKKTVSVLLVLVVVMALMGFVLVPAASAALPDTIKMTPATGPAGTTVTVEVLSGLAALQTAGLPVVIKYDDKEVANAVPTTDTAKYTFPATGAAGVHKVETGYNSRAGAFVSTGTTEFTITAAAGAAATTAPATTAPATTAPATTAAATTAPAAGAAATTPAKLPASGDNMPLALVLGAGVLVLAGGIALRSRSKA
jgi:preprotein translocase subunit SecG